MECTWQQFAGVAAACVLVCVTLWRLYDPRGQR